ncbi:MAG: aryldialkylphosphatase [Dehalococcoidia bacterium]|nr:aryldialkylphosphatase [Dehalococcoidia bacterium]
MHAVGTPDAIPAPDDDIAELDAAGGYILPGFIDAHVHLITEGAGVEKQLSTPFSLHFYLMVERMRRTVEAGVTSVRDAAGADLGVKRAVDEGLVVGPRIQIAITMLSPTGGHGDGWLPSGIELRYPPHPGRPDGRCNGVEEVRAKVREVLRCGADVVKVATTGGVYSPTTEPTHTKFAPEELAVIVQEAAYRDGTRVMAHAHGAGGIKNAVRAGIHSIEHGTYIDEEAIELMLERGTFLVPTLAVHLATLEAAESDEKPAEWAIRKGREVTDIHRENIAKAYKAGVRIAMGTDTAIAPHGTNLRELGLMCEIGMSPMESIVATTKVAAECLGWEDNVGTVEAGKLADIVISKTDPLADIRSLEKIENIAVVIKDGQIVKDRREMAA